MVQQKQLQQHLLLASSELRKRSSMLLRAKILLIGTLIGFRRSFSPKNMKNACPTNLTVVICNIGISLAASFAKTSSKGARRQKPNISPIPRILLSELCLRFEVSGLIPFSVKLGSFCQVISHPVKLLSFFLHNWDSGIIVSRYRKIFPYLRMSSKIYNQNMLDGKYILNER